jgi:hypothetical protein
MLHYSLRALMLVVLAAAIACAVLFAFPPWLRASALFVGVLAMPGPLYVLYRIGDRSSKAFALGGLVAYVAWFIVVGVPSGFGIVTASSQTNLGSVVLFADQPLTDTIGVSLNLSGYVFFALLYAPWLIVPLAGFSSMAIRWLAGRHDQNIR